MKGKHLFLAAMLLGMPALAQPVLKPGMAVGPQLQRTNQKTMSIQQTDPEWFAITENFKAETRDSVTLSDRDEALAVISCLVAQNTPNAFRSEIPALLKRGLEPVDIREALYHATAYVGLARVQEFLLVLNAELEASGVSLPLEHRGTVTKQTRFAEGRALQDAWFGKEHIDQLFLMPEDKRHIATFLADNCFGDYQTRSGFTPQERELMTFSLLISLGGVDPQAIAHAGGNVNVGNDREKLLAIATRLLPYNGYPRTLNAFGFIDKATGK